ncbi:class II aldolase/adducin family protein [Galbitalea sp. SE-J8]|uniref:class II aldolase/adducin family protein n=1 Tax=Galbitalea sp. SE-J8 TaxID=3054952 RepID=UPI00259CDD6C|nr:class II aldolase/adducin family protein [Galbitalea sp. SE-J8]MDM4762976.1 class II aldolase/adducin family protein [Galbitalea sp. SE-J8]
MNEHPAPIDELIVAGAQITATGVNTGSSGNISVRDGDRIHITASGSSLGTLTPADVAVLDVDGAHLRGPRPSKEWALHRAFYRRNPAHRAVVHLHSPNAVAVSCLEPWSEYSAIPPLTPYFVMRVGQTPLIPFRVPGSAELADLVAELRFPFRAALLANHGQIVSGATMSAAIDGAIEVEEASRTVLLTEGRSPRVIPAPEVSELAATWDSPWSARR